MKYFSLICFLCVFMIHWHARTPSFSFNRSLVRMRELRYRHYLAECRTFFSCQTAGHGTLLFQHSSATASSVVSAGAEARIFFHPKSQPHHIEVPWYSQCRQITKPPRHALGTFTASRNTIDPRIPRRPLLATPIDKEKTRNHHNNVARRRAEHADHLLGTPPRHP
jgi:hypothetical protein